MLVIGREQAMQDCNEVKEGMCVKVGKLESTTGMMISPKYLKVRREGAVGTVKGYVPGHGGDVWWVEHDKPSAEEPQEPEVAAYVYTEFEPLAAEKAGA
jgi:hypothetical protein